MYYNRYAVASLERAVAHQITARLHDLRGLGLISGISRPVAMHGLAHLWLHGHAQCTMDNVLEEQEADCGACLIEKALVHPIAG